MSADLSGLIRILLVLMLVSMVALIVLFVLFAFIYISTVNKIDTSSEITQHAVNQSQILLNENTDITKEIKGLIHTNSLDIAKIVKSVENNTARSLDNIKSITLNSESIANNTDNINQNILNSKRNSISIGVINQNLELLIGEINQLTTTIKNSTIVVSENLTLPQVLTNITMNR